MWAIAAAAELLAVVTLGIWLYRERRKARESLLRERELNKKELRAEEERERLEEQVSVLSERVKALEERIKEREQRDKELYDAAARVFLYAQIGGEKAASRELKGILQVIGKESREIMEFL